MKKVIDVEFDGKIYGVEVEKLVYTLNILENEKINPKETNLRKMLDKYKLYDDIFLTNVNKLW